jgi:hypothetical protein
MLSNGVSTFLDSSHRRSPTIAKQLRGADDLRKLLLFDGLTDEQLTQVCSNARIQVYGAGPVVEEGRRQAVPGAHGR